MKDRHRERKKDRKRELRMKERVLRQDSDKDGNLIDVHYTKQYIYKYMLYTYQQLLHLIENDEAYLKEEPKGKKRGQREWIDRKRDRKKETER